jgi:hypothetical protein
MSKEYWNADLEVEDLRVTGQSPAWSATSSGWEVIVAAGILALAAIACTIIYVHGRARDPEPSPTALRGPEIASTPERPIEKAPAGLDGASGAKPTSEDSLPVPPRSRPASSPPTKTRGPFAGTVLDPDDQAATTARMLDRVQQNRDMNLDALLPRR